MCDELRPETGVAGATCFALSVAVRDRYPDASLQLVRDFEELLGSFLNHVQPWNHRFHRDPVTTVGQLWQKLVERKLMQE